MKRYSPIVTAFFLSACGGSPGPCNGDPINASWKDAAINDVVTFTDQCSFSDTLCAYNGSYPNVTGTTGTVAININASNGASGCLPVGQVPCAYDVSDPNTLKFQCVDNTHPVLTYTRQ